MACHPKLARDSCRSRRMACHPKLARDSCERRMERETGIEPATNSLEGCDSTTELLPPTRSTPSLFRATAGKPAVALPARLAAELLRGNPLSRFLLVWCRTTAGQTRCRASCSSGAELLRVPAVALPARLAAELLRGNPLSRFL